MTFFVNDLKKYIDRFASNVYIFNYSYSYFIFQLNAAVEKENLNYVVHPHLFRHTFATRLFGKYSDQTVKKLMNWSKNSNMTTKYSHLRKKDMADEMHKMKLN